jgi:hypothetical protein
MVDTIGEAVLLCCFKIYNRMGETAGTIHC